MNPPEIIVGIDGSPASRGAVQWAAAEAVRRHTELAVVHAYEWRVVGARVQVGGAIEEDARAHAQELVDAAVADAREFAPEVTVRGEAVEGSPGHVLVGASRRGGLVVVGSRGRGGFASLLLGSVSQQVATHAHGPVVVVRGRAAESIGPVVVGTDGSDAGRYAVGVAFAEAAARGAELFAIRAYQPANPPWTYGVPPYVEDWEQRREAERAALVDDVAPWAEKYPDVHVQTVVVEGHAADSLVRYSADAQLVVVGTRGHGGFTGLLLGSVGLQLLHHADGPVLIARQPESAPA